MEAAADRSARRHYGPEGRSEWLDIDWREHLRWVRVDGCAVNLVELGDGPPLVFIHGLGGSWRNWLENLPAFAGDHRVIAPDLPGFGDSEMPAAPISINAYARWVDDLLGQLDVERAVVVGNSMGGFVGAEMAIECPRRVDRLVLVAAAGISIQAHRHDRAMAMLYRLETVLAAYTAWMAGRSERLARRRRLRRQLLGMVAAHPGLLPPALTAEQIRGTGKPGFLPALDALTSYPLRERLERIACPTLIVWGDRDRLVPLRDADEFERLIPDARKVVYADTGHVPMLERPDRFNADVAAFARGDALSG
ncbi:MAG TPA: alpha/beta hydrolase [Solirubrobacteraceae bacterium]|nr:alpha/beta hydrolase [Solirubrobacteraceae bacterium]